MNIVLNINEPIGSPDNCPRCKVCHELIETYSGSDPPSLSDSALMTLRSEDDALKLMRVRATSGAIKVTRSYIDETQDMGMQAINVNLWAWSPELVEYARSQGLITSGWAWPSADESTNTDAIELDLDMWMTDRLDDLHSKLGR